MVHHQSPDEPEGGWLGPRGPDGWPDLEALDRKQRGEEVDLSGIMGQPVSSYIQ